MTKASRANPTWRAATLLVAAALTLVGCGGGGSSSPAAGASQDVAPTSPTSPTSPATRTPAPTQTPTKPRSTTQPATDFGAEQTVRIAKYGVSYRIPKGWTTLDGKKLLDPHNPVLRDVAGKLGTTPEQLVSNLSTAIQSYSVTDQGAVNGFLDNLDAAIIPVPELNVAQIKLQLAQIGAKPGRIVRGHSHLGGVIRVPYDWTTNGHAIHGVAITVDIGDVLVDVTISSHDRAIADRLADEVQASLAKLG